MTRSPGDPASAKASPEETSHHNHTSSAGKGGEPALWDKDQFCSSIPTSVHKLVMSVELAAAAAALEIAARPSVALSKPNQRDLEDHG
mmetsp:Transcript_5135/g.12376  ORF Transcript_5135/g.12376 Transcript_5135/m.12376 type:complete len:88 (+) Transcript_5135:1097-1360(+)